MIKIDQAFDIINNVEIPFEEELVELIKAPGRITSQDITSDIDMPLFNNTAMDGYAYNSKSTSNTYKLIEIIPAGYKPEHKVNPGECSKIMTGAMVPEGADRIMRVEYTEEKGDIVTFLQQDDNDHIRYKGQDLKKGETVIKKGTLIRTQEVSSLSAIGKTHISAYKKPTVGIITTGSELINPGEELTPGKIFNSNGIQLSLQVKSVLSECNYYGTAIDDEAATRAIISKAFSECDLILLSGGVSKGDFDYVPSILESLSVNIKFSRVAIKPGKPTVFGIKDNKYVFGLPGNPVSTFVIFEVFVKPFIYKMMGYNYKPLILKGILTDTYKRKNAERAEFVPVIYDGKNVTPIKYHGSGHIYALAKTNALIRIEQEVMQLDKGTEVNVRQI